MSAAESERMAGYLVKRVQQALRRHCDAGLKPTGVSIAQYSVLRALADHPQASAAELARQCFVTRQSLQDTLTGLRASGLIADGEGVASGRARSLKLTRAGQARLQSGAAALDEVEEALLQGISPAARDQLVRLLTRCAENLDG